MDVQTHILYCHCSFARIIPEEVKNKVLKKLTEEGVPFEAVADLCELSARQDDMLKNFSQKKPLKIAACYPRAVRCLFEAADAPLPREDVEILNMRVGTAKEIIRSLKQTKSTKQGAK